MADSLLGVFDKFNGGKGMMDGRTFAKLAKDSKLLSKRMTATDVDLIFAKVKCKTERRITYDQFDKAVAEMATKSGISASEVSSAIVGASGPKFSGTVAEANKFHDDPKLYTGAHKFKPGAPSTGKGSLHSIAIYVGPADVEKASDTNKSGVTRDVIGDSASVVSSAVSGTLVQKAFTSFTRGVPEMDGKSFAKMSKDCKLLDNCLTSTDIDLIFAKVKNKGHRKIGYAQFEMAVRLIAAKKSTTVMAVSEQIVAAGTPIFSGTKAEAVKYHDDKSLYTGVHANGGPSISGGGAVHDISSLCDRTAADVRGVKLRG